MKDVPKLKFYKNNKTDIIYWVENMETKGVWEFSFDRKKVYNMFADYPHNLTGLEKAIFDKENPYWCDFFADRNDDVSLELLQYAVMGDAKRAEEVIYQIKHCGKSLIAVYPGVPELMKDIDISKMEYVGSIIDGALYLK